MTTSDNMTTISAAPRPTVLKPTPEGSGLDARTWAVIGIGIPTVLIALFALILGLLKYLNGDNVIGRRRQRSTTGRRRHSRSQEEDSEQGIPRNTSMPTAPAGETNATRSKSEQRRAKQTAASRCRKALKEIYTSTGSYVQMLPWVDDDKKHIMDIYTKLQLEKGDTDLKGKVKSYWDIFKLKSKEGHPIIRAILRGWAGLGKTTLIDKIAYDWACGSVAALKKYKLVFVLKMHSLQQKSDVIDALFDQLLDKKTINREDLKSFITANPEDVLFLLDGFDEFMSTELDVTEFSSILKMLNRKGEYKKCSVLVTTRPSHYDKLVKKTLIQKPFAVVNVLGFSKHDIEEYVHKFYSEEPSKADGLLQRIKSSVLTDLASSPMMLLLMCLLWRESATLPDTMFRLYDKALFYIFKRKGITSTEEISRLVIAIGKVALGGLLSSDQKLTFQEEDFDPDVLDLAIRSGILTSQRVFKDIDTCKRVHFIHKTFQEFCAAKCYQSLTSEGETQPFQTFFLQLSETAGFEYLLRFCCGDNEGPRTNSILNILSHKVKRAGALDDKHLQLALHCYFESQSQTLPPLELIHHVIVPTLCVEIESRDELTSLMYFLHNVTDQTQDGGNAYLNNIQSLRTSPVAFGTLGAEFVNYMTRMANLRDFHISAEHRLSFFSYNCIPLLNSCLKEMTSLQSVTLLSCRLMPYYMELVVGGLSSMPNLVELDLSGNTLLAGSRRSWSYLTEIKTLNKLVLRVCNLSRNDIQHIAVALSNMPNLEELDLSKNETLAGSGRSWSHLKKIKTLKKLVLNDCSLSMKDIKHIAVAVRNMPNLEGLDLFRNTCIPLLDPVGHCLT
ncbi:NACHT, LRR and PYD domains-containing protein 3-like [Patiria miniata]|uniref:NACHT domain-containing protein n=1 Tax=Patiria miniata TaxID=46514 RepID=A0A914A7P5_PATMI|nr:NACHT, LRR and PYD domains-containing protein 3-like [Patiria miniata]